MQLSIYLGRQPIYDNKGDIFAYELLYRNTGENSASVENNMHATARVFVNALNYIGLNTLTKGKVAFIKVDDKTLMDDIIYSISPVHFVLEILESSVISPDLIRRIEQLHKKGYRFALNHYDSSADFLLHFQPLLEFVEYAKLTLYEGPKTGRVLSELDKYDIKCIAEKIEDQESFEIAKMLSFDYYQGYYFARPHIFKKDRIDPDSSLLLELIYLLKTNASMDDLIAKFNTSPYLIINLLKLIRSHDGLTPNTLSSIEQALILIGRERLGNWLELMIYAYDEENEEESNHARQLSQQAHHRACLMEEFARRTKKSERYASAAYMAGLLSMSELLLKDRFPELLKQMRVEKNISDALLKKSGELGQLLELAIAVEQNHEGHINSIIGQLYLSQQQFNECVLASYRRSSSEL